MSPKIVIPVLLGVAILLVGGVFLLNQNPEPQQTPSPSPSATPISQPTRGEVLEFEVRKLVGFNTRPVSWSPDGRKIAYLETGTNPAVETIIIRMIDDPTFLFYFGNVDGTEKPSWAPDAQSIVYATLEGIEETRFSDTSNSQLLYSGKFVQQPTWNSDGSRIAFMQNNNIWTVNASGQHKQQVTDNGKFSKRNIQFTQDGKRIFYEQSSKPAIISSYESWIVDIDGTNQRKLTVTEKEGIELVYNGSYNPDRTEVVYVNDKGIAISNSDGSNEVQLTNEPNDRNPSWSPDGKMIMFSRSYEIQIIEFETAY